MVVGTLGVAMIGCAVTGPLTSPATLASDGQAIQGRGEDKDEWWRKLPRAAWSRYPTVAQSQAWFEVHDLGSGVFAIYEPGQFEEVISYLILGRERALLFDTGLGIGDMKRLVDELTTLPVVVVNSHTHYDHVGGNHQFDRVLNLATPYTEKNSRGRPHADVAEFVSEGWIWKPLPEGVTRAGYESKPWRIAGWVTDGQTIDLGDRVIEVLVTPGHAPDSLCLLDRGHRLLFTGDTFYPAPLYVHLGGSDFDAYVATAQRLAALEAAVDWVLPAHNEPRMEPSQLGRLRAAFARIQEPDMPFVRTDGAREYDFGRFSLIVSDPPPWQEE